MVVCGQTEAKTRQLFEDKRVFLQWVNRVKMNQTINQRVRELKVTVRTQQTASQASKNNS